MMIDDVKQILDWIVFSSESNKFAISEAIDKFIDWFRMSTRSEEKYGKRIKRSKATLAEL